MIPCDACDTHAGCRSVKRCQLKRGQTVDEELREKVEKSLYSIYGSWHACALGTPKNPLMAADKARGLKKGQLCDDCNSMVAAYMKDIFE